MRFGTGRAGEWLCTALLSLAALLIASPVSAETVLVEFGSSMSYLDNSTDPGIALDWIDRNFDDSGWAAGQYGVGYEAGSGAENLLLTTVPTDTISVYTRAVFAIDDPDRVRNLILGADYDDGYVAWINGVEVYRSGSMPSGDPDWNTLASDHESSNGAVPDYELQNISTIAIPVLRKGENVLAIGVWNATQGSSDLVLAPWLIINMEATITRGPYLQSATTDGVTIRWRTQVGTDSIVQCGPSPGSLVLCASDPVLTTEHIVPLSGFPADNRIYYAVGWSDTILAGNDSEHYFDTHPPIGPALPMRIWVLSDTGFADADQAAVRDAYVSYTSGTETNLWIHIGDVSQTTGTDEQYQNEFFDMYPDQLRNIVFWPTIGNHDEAHANSASQSGPYYDNFTLPKNGESGGYPSYTEAYYSFDYANVHFVVLNSCDLPREPGSPMLLWLDNDLASTTQDWIIAYWHHPPYSKGSHDSDTEINMVEMRQYVLPILEDHGVDLAFSGHTHAYERSYLIDGHYGFSTDFAVCDDNGTPGVPADDFCANSPSTPCPNGIIDCDLGGYLMDAGDGREDGDGVYEKPERGPDPHEGAVYNVVGTGGEVRGGPLDHPAMYISWNNIGSLVLDIAGNRLDATFINQFGSVLDHYSIQKGCADDDSDGTCEVEDNCPGLYNPSQSDADSDGAGDPCDYCPFDPDNDIDSDGLCGNVDNCPDYPNPGQADGDSDGVGDPCDPAPGDPDADDDGVPDGADCAPTVTGVSESPGEVGPSLRIDKSDGTMLRWQRGFQGHTSNIYRAEGPTLPPLELFGCHVTETPHSSLQDPDPPANGEIYWYLITARNSCGESEAGAGGSRAAWTPCPSVGGDYESDGIPDLDDNCPLDPNPGQSDGDLDFVGDTCDNCIDIPNPEQADCDSDGDGNACDPDTDCDGDSVPDEIDNCPGQYNPTQMDTDSDGVGDPCDPCPLDPDDDIDTDGACADEDNCPATHNPAQWDWDSDGAGDLCDPCPFDPDDDGDSDGACGNVDNCPVIPNPGQEDGDADSIGDACDNCPAIFNFDQADGDGDGAGDLCDNCPSTPNAVQLDRDSDGTGDACDPCPFDPEDDIDSDGICADLDNCPGIYNPGQEDADSDGIGDPCDTAAPDDDSDGVPDDVDNCLGLPNPGQSDLDSDGFGDDCDTCPDIPDPGQEDQDSDGVGDLCDNCPEDPNPSQQDNDDDGVGNGCDNCINAYNPGQEDSDGDGKGDACDPNKAVEVPYQEP